MIENRTKFFPFSGLRAGENRISGPVRFPVSDGTAEPTPGDVVCPLPFRPASGPRFGQSEGSANQAFFPISKALVLVPAATSRQWPALLSSLPSGAGRNFVPSRKDAVFAGRVVTVTLLGVAVDQLYSIVNTTKAIAKDSGCEILDSSAREMILECAGRLDRLMNGLPKEERPSRLQ